MPRLSTERLVLRPFDVVDGPDVERLAGAWEVAGTTLNIPHPYPPGGGAEWIATHDDAWQRGSRLTLAVCSRDEPGEIRGAIGLHISAPHQHAEIGYWIAAAHWGKGYATEASRAIVAYAFSDLRLHRVQARHFTRNPASGRVMQKLGMRLEGVNRDVFWRFGRFEDVALYAILATEWEINAGDSSRSIPTP